MSLTRLDHIIYSVPNIEKSHRALLKRYPEAWPIGRFWPDGLTSGLAIGGVNLELIHFDVDPPGSAVGTALAFQPSSFEDAVADFARAGLSAIVVNKTESDPEKLRLRGFSERESQTPQWICRNLVPERPEDLPFDFFICEYAPFLKRHLSPENPRLETADQIIGIKVGTTDPEAARALLTELRYLGEIRIRFTGHDDRRIVEVMTSAGPLSGF